MLPAESMGPAEVLPSASFRVALRIQDLRTRVFRSVKLKDHPLRIRNAGIRCRVQESDFVVRKPKIYSTDVIFKLLHLPGRDDYAAHSRASQDPRERHTGRA